ncbi:MAG: hypothetical protein HRF49_12110 [bacterium]|jgi:anti-sigma regulatory factor (Ser/Thr protein kinase)
MIKTEAFSKHVIDIKLPAAEEYASVLRLFVAGIGNLWDMTTGEIEDLKLTVSEAFLDIVARARDAAGQVSVRWKVDADRAVVTLTDPSRTLRKVTQSPVLMLLREKGTGVEIVNVAGEQNIELGISFPRKFDTPGGYRGES